MNRLSKYVITAVVGSMLLPVSAQNLGRWQKNLSTWQFSKDQSLWTTVEIPHSCNAQDGHSAAYFRGKAYYKKTLTFTKADMKKNNFLLFEGAAQAAQVFVNGTYAINHRGGYTPFVLNLKGLIHEGENEIKVMCDNHEDPLLIPVSSDFNKNNGLHNPVFLLQMDDIYASPVSHGLYRMHVTTPQVSAEQAQTTMKTELVNATKKSQTFDVTFTIKDQSGKTCYEKTVKQTLAADKSQKVEDSFTIQNPHLWNGLEDPYLYQATITVHAGKKVFDEVTTKYGYRFFQMTADKGFFLNGKSYPLRGVCEHQDWAERASALFKENYDKDYEIIQELGCNMLRLAHYPHNDYEFRKCDSLGIIVQTEIPWVNVCGVNVQQCYFDNIHHQMWEMITNLYNHPSIVFWGMWNELDSWGNKPELQGKLNIPVVPQETNKLYKYAKSLDPYRQVGFTDDSQLRHAGWSDAFEVDYVSENRYNGWYQRYGQPEGFTLDMTHLHGLKSAQICNVAEYGAGVNPFCHTTDTLMMVKRTDDTRHYEEYGNWIQESHLQQIVNMPFLNFTTVWVLFDFAVAARQEGFMDSDDGVYFVENENRKYTNDKGLVTRDRKVKKDVFYLYKSMWNKKQTTVYITSRRMHARPADKPIYITVYSNAKSLTLYQNGEKVATMNATGENTGVIWKFAPQQFKTDKDTFKVVSDDGTTDEVTWSKFKKA